MNALSNRTANACKNLAAGRWPLTVEVLHRVVDIARQENVDLAEFSTEIDAAFARASDEQKGNVAVDARIALEQSTGVLRWIINRADTALYNTAVARRQGDEAAKVAIPHERADIELVPEFGPYSFDVEALETVLPLLKDDERKKLLKIEPEREEPILPLSQIQQIAIGAAIALLESAGVTEAAIGDGTGPKVIPVLRSLFETRTVPRRVTAGATVSITAIADRYRGSNVEALIRSAMRREKIRDVLRVTPRVSIEPKVVSA